MRFPSALFPGKARMAWREPPDKGRQIGRVGA